MIFTILIIITISKKFAIYVLAEVNENPDDFVVVVKEDGLWEVSLTKPGSQVNLDKTGSYKEPKISPDGRNVAYTKNQILNIAATDRLQESKIVLDVTESYTWGSSSDLFYGPKYGGLYRFDLKSGKTSVCIKSNNHYEGIQSDGQGKIYGQLIKCSSNNENTCIKDIGVISFDIASGKEKLIIPSKPTNFKTGDAGFMPEVAGISRDGAYVYIWCKVHSASTNSDGAGFGVYDVKNNEFTNYSRDKIFALSYSDNLAINPINGRLPVINNGGMRDMNINKTLGILDISNRTFTNILPDYMIAKSESYDEPAKGMVTMTPSFSKDAEKIIFAASEANNDMHQWEKMPHNIYTVDIKSKKVEKITKDKAFNFLPIYLSDKNEIMFARRNDGKNVSLWRLNGNKEECITSNIKLDEYSWYYGHISLENSLGVYIHK